MKRHFFIYVILVSITISAIGQSENTREVIDFNDGWKYKKEITPWVFRYDFGDSNWETIDVPHDWSINGPFDSAEIVGKNGAYLPTGKAVYRKNFKIPEKYQNKRIFIEIDGIYMNATVHCNGVKIGNRPFGYASYSYDLSPWINYGDKSNVIAILVDNSDQINSRWYSGSGIYSDIRLVIKNDIHIPQWGSFVYSLNASEESSELIIENEVKNTREHREVLYIKNLIESPKGIVVGINEMSDTISQDEKIKIISRLKIENPSLWSVKEPHMYHLITELFDTKGNLLDRKKTPFGIRSIQFDKDIGFILNGEQLKIKGVCLHHDAGALGAAVPTEVWHRRLKILKNMGCNAIRTSHNPFAPSFYDLCDTMGILVMDEIFDEWTVPTLPEVTQGYNHYWDNWYEKDLRDFVKRDRNHPSIIIWSAGNEIIEQTHQHGYILAKKLQDIFHELDPSRPVTCGNNMMHEANKTGFADIWDVVGYNYAVQFGIYQSEREKYPERKFIGTENTRGLSTRGEYFWPLDGNKVMENNGYFNSYDGHLRKYGMETEWKVTRDNDWISGLFLWTGFDYLGEASGEWPVTTAQFGVLDRCGFPKDAYYFYQSQWNDDEDVLKILPHWNWLGNEGEKIPVWIYTNTEKVELFLNGKSLGSKNFESTDKLHLEWEVKYHPGTLKAVGSKADGSKIETTIETTTNPDRIELTPDKKFLTANSKDVMHLELTVVDKEGRFIQNANIPFSIDITENLKLLGIDNGDPKFTGSFTDIENCRTFNGKSLIILQSNNSGGEAVIRVNGKNLKKSSSISLKIKDQ